MIQFPAPASLAADPKWVAALQKRLLAWYRRNRRALPWRATRDPYRIWVSEVMLQQTQIATALPFYQSFLARFPTVERLARAGEAEVLAAWSGLGYYRRARHLLAAARLVVREHGGQVPGDEAAFGDLPGVGRYTRGAVLSIAFDHPLPVLDGNVARVLSRLFVVPWAMRDPRGARALWNLAALLVAPRAPGDWNQALMELGATVCTPRLPKCGACPVRTCCAARAQGTVERFPPVPKRAATITVRRAVAVVQSGRHWLLVRREGRQLEGLWEPPGVEIGARAGKGATPARATRATARAPRAPGARPPAELVAALARLGVRTALSPTLHRVKHRITNRAIEVEVWETRVAATKRGAGGSRAKTRWVDVRSPGVALTGLTRRLARLIGSA